MVVFAGRIGANGTGLGQSEQRLVGLVAALACSLHWSNFYSDLEAHPPRHRFILMTVDAVLVAALLFNGSHRPSEGYQKAYSRNREDLEKKADVR